MNYFELHIGDYAEATQHLSILEDGVYCRLLRKYYASEKPLPSEISAVQRLVVARTKEEKRAVELVLQEFFVLAEEGWHQPRCDLEIERYRAGEPERKAKKANEETRVRRHRDERAALFKQLTDAGEHALWNIPIKELRERVSALSTKAPADQPVTEPATPETLRAGETETAPATPATATQTPLTTTQTPTNSIYTAAPPPAEPKPKREKPRSKIPADFQPSASGMQLAAQSGLVVDREIGKFIDHHTAKGSLMADWQAAWRTWVGHAVEYGRAKPAESPQKRGLVL